MLIDSIKLWHTFSPTGAKRRLTIRYLAAEYCYDKSIACLGSSSERSWTGATRACASASRPWSRHKPTPNINRIDRAAPLLVIPVLVTGIHTSTVRRKIPVTSRGMTIEGVLHLKRLMLGVAITVPDSSRHAAFTKGRSAVEPADALTPWSEKTSGESTNNAPDIPPHGWASSDVSWFAFDMDWHKRTARNRANTRIIRRGNRTTIYS
jgi:hypothetical protein